MTYEFPPKKAGSSNLPTAIFIDDDIQDEFNKRHGDMIEKALSLPFKHKLTKGANYEPDNTTEDTIGDGCAGDTAPDMGQQDKAGSSAEA